MAELRKKLTDVQFRLLIDAQIKYDNSVVVLNDTTSNLNTIRALVLDAHDIDNETASWIDASTQELVIQEEESINE